MADQKTDPKTAQIEQLAERFEFLDDLRESGLTNMFGAAPYLAEEFGLDKNEANENTKSWMTTFDGESSALKRAEQEV